MFVHVCKCVYVSVHQYKSDCVYVCAHVHTNTKEFAYTSIQNNVCAYAHKSMCTWIIMIIIPPPKKNNSVSSSCNTCLHFSLTGLIPPVLLTMRSAFVYTIANRTQKCFACQSILNILPIINNYKWSHQFFTSSSYSIKKKKKKKKKCDLFFYFHSVKWK